VNEGILYSIATVASTLAGFSGAVFVFRQQAMRDWAETEQRYLWFLIGDSFLVVLFALLPVPLMLTGLALDYLWAILSALLGTWFFIAIAIALRGEVRDRRNGHSRSISFVTPLLGVLSIVAVAMGIALWLSAIGFIVPRGQAIYVFGLLLLLTIAALEFMFFIGRAALDGRTSGPTDPPAH
jgi:hypothetical protein